jgi:hypothetical protein
VTGTETAVVVDGLFVVGAALVVKTEMVIVG